MNKKLMIMAILLINSVFSYSMSNEEYKAYQVQLHTEGSRLGRKLTMDEWEKGVSPQPMPGMNFILNLNEEYEKSRFKNFWQGRGFRVPGAFFEKSLMEVDCISDNDTLNLLVVQSGHLRLSGIELQELIVNKCADVTSDQLLKAMLIASVLDSTGEYNFYLDRLYKEKLRG